MPNIVSYSTDNAGTSYTQYDDGSGTSIISGGGIFSVIHFPAWAPAPAPAAVAATTGVNPVETSYSLYGHNIPLTVFGVGRIGGDIISGPWIENGAASFCISFGVPADPGGSRDLREIAFDSEVVWDSTNGFYTEPFTYRFYEGTLTQAADPLEISHFGADAVAYRPQILLWFENLPLANTKFQKIPYVAAVFGDSTGDDVNLGEAFERLAASPWVNLDAFETSGITDGLVHGGLIFVEQAEFLATIQQFGRFYPNWDVLQTDKLRIVDRGSNVTADLTLDRTTLMGSVAFARLEPNSTPRELELTTIDPDADYTLVPSTAKRPRDPVNVTSSVKVDTAYLPAIMSASFRQSIATYALYHEEQARKKVSLTAMIYGLELEPGDLIALSGLGDDFEDEVLKVISTTHGANYAVEIQAEAILRCTVSGAYSPTTPGALAQWAVSRSRILVPGYAGPLDAITSGKVTTWYDQSGHDRPLITSGVGPAPIATTSGPNSRECCDFAPSSPSSAQEMHSWIGSTPPDRISDVMSVSTGYMVASIRPDVVTQNPTSAGSPVAAHLCAAVLRGGGISSCGLSLRSGGMLHAWNNDGSGSVSHLGGDPDKASSAVSTVPIAGNPCVIEWWHQGGFLHQRVNGAGETSVPSGDTLDLSGAITMGFGGISNTEYNGKIFEAMIFNPVPTLAERNAIVADMMAWVEPDVPVLDACINATYEPGNIGSSSGTPPVIIRGSSLYDPDDYPVDDVPYALDFSKVYDSMYLGVI